MSVYKRGGVYWYNFFFAGRRIQESAKTASKTLAKEAEKKRRRKLEEGYNGVTDEDRSRRVMTVAEAADEFIAAYKLRHRNSSTIYTMQRLAHLKRFVGHLMLVEVGENTVCDYQNARIGEKASAKSINEEMRLLLCMMRDEGDIIRVRMKRTKTLKLKADEFEGKALSTEEVERLYEAARVPEIKPGSKKNLKATRTPMILPAVALALNATLRLGEIESLKWGQVDFLKNRLIVGRSKTDAGTGRTIPINSELRAILESYRSWYEQKVGPAVPDYYLFPFGSNNKWNPSRPITTLKSGWRNVRAKAGLKARFHDLRHTAITNLCESGAPEATIMAIAGHVSRRMMERYAHIRTESKRQAVERIVRQGSVPATSPDKKEVAS